MRAPKYPFEPKSNAHLRPGQFWGVPLSNGRWTCGRVLSMKTEADDYFPGNSQLFLAALMSWHGTVMIYEGATPLRSATKEEAATMPVFSTWGSKVISLLAERAFVAPRPGRGVLSC